MNTKQFNHKARRIILDYLDEHDMTKKHLSLACGKSDTWLGGAMQMTTRGYRDAAALVIGAHKVVPALKPLLKHALSRTNITEAHVLTCQAAIETGAWKHPQPACGWIVV